MFGGFAQVGGTTRPLFAAFAQGLQPAGGREGRASGAGRASGGPGGLAPPPSTSPLLQPAPSAGWSSGPKSGPSSCWRLARPSLGVRCGSTSRCPRRRRRRHCCPCRQGSLRQRRASQWRVGFPPSIHPAWVSLTQSPSCRPSLLLPTSPLTRPAAVLTLPASLTGISVKPEGLRFLLEKWGVRGCEVLWQQREGAKEGTGAHAKALWQDMLGEGLRPASDQ